MFDTDFIASTYDQLPANLKPKIDVKSSDIVMLELSDSGVKSYIVVRDNLCVMRKGNIEFFIHHLQTERYRVIFAFLVEDYPSFQGWSITSRRVHFHISKMMIETIRNAKTGIIHPMGREGRTLVPSTKNTSYGYLVNSSVEDTMKLSLFTRKFDLLIVNTGDKLHLLMATPESRINYRKNGRTRTLIDTVVHQQCPMEEIYFDCIV